MIPRVMISPPENHFQKVEGTSINRVVVFSARENTNIEKERDAIII